METPSSHEQHTPSRKAAVNGLAVVGVIALVVGGILLVVYAARYIPETLSRLAGAVYLSPEETVNPEDEETPVETPETPETPVTPTTPGTTSTPAVNPPVKTTPGGVITVPRALTGSPDLQPEILALGYLQNNSANSFVTANDLSANDRPAIRFRVRNVGTNAVNYWQVRVEYPTEDSQDSYVITSRDLLMPGGYKDFTFGFDNPDEGSDRLFVVTADPGNGVRESNEGNNRDSASIDIGRTSGSNNNSSRLACDLSVSPSRIDEGERATLRWEADGADDARINEGIGSVDEDEGSERVSPREDTTYRLTVENDDDTETCSVTLRVDED